MLNIHFINSYCTLKYNRVILKQENHNMDKLYEAFWQKQENRLQKIKHMKFEKDNVYSVPLGGIGEIGMNALAYHYKDNWIMVDFGNSFDRLYTHQSHVVFPSTAFFQDKKDKLKAIVITHGHEDHIGGIMYIWESLRCPIYATKFTAALIKRKFEEKGLPTDHIVIIEPGQWYDLGTFKVKWILVTHSIPGSCMVAIRTEHGSILQTGDWKIDEAPLINEITDFESIKQLAREDLNTVICDSTNINVEGRNPTEESVGESLREIIRNIRVGRVYVTFFSTNVSRLLSCIKAAKIAGRKVGIVGRALQRTYEVSIELGLIEKEDHVMTQGFENIPSNELLIACSGSQGEINSALRRVANAQHPLLNIDKGDTVIFSSRMIPTNAKEIVTLENALLCRGIRVITEKDALVHTSGHARKDEIIMLYNLIKEHASRQITVIPCHGTSVFMDRHNDLAHSMGFKTIHRDEIFFNGRIYEISPELKFFADIEHEVMFIDGTHVVSTASPIVTERQSLEHGYVSIAVLMKDNQLANVSVNTCGVCEDSDQLLADLRNLVTKLVRFRNMKYDVYQTISFGVTNYLLKLMDHKVRVNIHVLNDKRLERRPFIDESNPKYSRDLGVKVGGVGGVASAGSDNVEICANEDENIKTGLLNNKDNSSVGHATEIHVHVTDDDLLV